MFRLGRRHDERGHGRSSSLPRLFGDALLAFLPLFVVALVLVEAEILAVVAAVQFTVTRAPLERQAAAAIVVT